MLALGGEGERREERESGERRGRGEGAREKKEREWRGGERDTDRHVMHLYSIMQHKYNTVRSTIDHIDYVNVVYMIYGSTKPLVVHVTCINIGITVQLHVLIFGV